jgi:hypothetical protein
MTTVDLYLSLVFGSGGGGLSVVPGFQRPSNCTHHGYIYLVPVASESIYDYYLPFYRDIHSFLPDRYYSVRHIYIKYILRYNAKGRNYMDWGKTNIRSNNIVSGKYHIYACMHLSHVNGRPGGS